MITYLHCNEGFWPTEDHEEKDWVCVVKPTEDEYELLQKKYLIPSSFLTDIKDLDERPRMDNEQEWTLVIFRIPRKKERQTVHFGTIPLCILFNEHHFISFCNEETEMLPDFITHTRRKKMQKGSHVELILRLVMSGAVWFMNYTNTINNAIIASEEKLERSIRNDDLLKLMKLDKSMVYFEASLQGNEILLDKIGSMLPIATANTNLYADVRTELHQAREMAAIYHGTLSSTIDAFASIISNNVNKIMKRMTGISLILMLPTLIASIYGMNVINYAEQSNWAFAAILLSSALISAGAFFWLRRSDWF